ncbi:reverse transcriptase domain-containing protein [Tanacetum coccineum]|uniref:Reverse transcriptase domain-containing protein n=1 Tax=Tanacetum coccineum TaxID=301880 RepID=A0ABQ5BLN0_9ASTR
MVDSQLEGEAAPGAGLEGTSVGPQEGPTEPAQLTQTALSPVFIKKNIDVLRTMIKEHDQQAKAKATPKKLAYDESEEENSDDSEAKGLSDPPSHESSGTSKARKRGCPSAKSQRSLSRIKTLSQLRRSERLEGRSRSKAKPRGERARSRGKRSGRMKYHEKAKLLRNVKVYEVSKDLEDHLGIFSTAAEQEEWHMPVWRRMFRQTLSGAARNWFDDLDPKSVDSFEELSQKFLEEFSQQNRYVKDPTEIHGIKRRMNEGLQAFMSRFKSESWHIKGVPPVLRISAFMHGHGHLKFSKKLNDKIPKTFDEMFKRVRAFIKGEAATRSAEVARASQWDKGVSRPGWSGGQERFRGRSGPREFRRNMCLLFRKGHTPPIILEGAIEGYHIRRIYVDGGSSSEIMYEHCFKSFGADVKSKLRKASALLVGFSSETYHPLGLIDLMDQNEKPWGSGFDHPFDDHIPNGQGSCHNEDQQGSHMGMQTDRENAKFMEETQWCQHRKQMSRTREQALLRDRNVPNQRSGKASMITEETWEEIH